MLVSIGSAIYLVVGVQVVDPRLTEIFSPFSLLAMFQGVHQGVSLFSNHLSSLDTRHHSSLISSDDCLSAHHVLRTR